MARRNPERSVVLPQDMAEALDVYSSKKRITTSQAIRQFIEKGLSIESYEQHQTEIRKYIRAVYGTTDKNAGSCHQSIVRSVTVQCGSTRRELH